MAGTPRHTIEHLVADYMERHAKPQHRRPEYVLAILERDVLPEWKGRDARTITPTEVIELLDKVLDRGSKVMANRLASLLSQLFRWGIHRRIVEDSPVKLLYRPGGKEKPRERTLSDAELTALLSIDPLPRWERLHRTINILLLTGQRRGDAAGGQDDQPVLGRRLPVVGAPGPPGPGQGRERDRHAVDGVSQHGFASDAAEYQIRGLGPLILSVPRLARSEPLLTGVLGMREVRTYTAPPASLAAESAEVHVFEMGDGGAEAELHFIEEAAAQVGRQGAGGVHHLALRIPDDDYHSWTDRLTGAGVAHSGEIDRFWFRSLYFREPNGILFEIATDGPGFAVDEDIETLGEKVVLPPFLERHRERIVENLKPID